MMYFLPAYVILMLVIALVSSMASVELKKKDEQICELVIQNGVLQRQLNNKNKEENQ